MQYPSISIFYLQTNVSMPKPKSCAENTALIMLPLCREGISTVVVVRSRVKKNLQDRVARLKLECSTEKVQCGKKSLAHRCAGVQWRRSKG